MAETQHREREVDEPSAVQLGRACIKPKFPSNSCDKDVEFELCLPGDVVNLASQRLKGHQQHWWARGLLPELDARDGASDGALVALKLLLLTLCGIGVTRWIVCDLLALECDTEYSMLQFLAMDVHRVCLDLTFLFFVGRMGEGSPVPVDSPLFVLAFFCGTLLPSLLNELPFLRVSVSLYQIRCKWHVSTFIFVGIVLVLIVFLVAVHVRFFWKQLSQVAKLRFVFELLIVLSVFALPRWVVSHGSFHLHHWYTQWFLALFCHWPVWWSRSLQALLLGGYVNGVAVYGHDPVLACEAAYLSASSLRCPWFEMCVWQRANHTEKPHFQAPNTDLCQPGDYT